MGKANEVGYFDRVLALDVETSGLIRGTGNPCINPKTGDYYQIVSIGLAVAGTKTLKPADTLYVEVKWDGKSLWDKGAERKHGLTKEYLEQNGMDDIEALSHVVDFIKTYWDSDAEYAKDRIVHLVGHNVSSFDIWFLRQLFEKYQIPFFPYSNQFIDTNAIGWITMDMFSSDKIFETIGTTRDKHNSLEDALLSLETVRRAKKICDVMDFRSMFESSF